MKYLVWDLKQQSRGNRVQVTLTGNAANVRLMDNSNYNNYKNGRNHRYVGGLAKQSPVTLGVPSSGHYFLVVDMQGLRGSTNASVRVLPNPLPEYREIPLSSIPSLVRGNNVANQDSEDDNLIDHDVFISHASEDKDDVVRVIMKNSRTGEGTYGDGKIFISKVDTAYTISTGKEEL